LINLLKSIQIRLGGLPTLSPGSASELESLRSISALIGRNPLLVQAATGNTSVKVDGVLWIKASGTWLANAATDEIMIPVNLAETRRRIERDIDPAGQTVLVGGKPLGTSVETAMHAVLPWRVVLHVHSVNTIAWAVRRDGPVELALRLEGIPWQWIPYVASGMPLARMIQDALCAEPRTRVLALANHGLVVCGDDSESAQALLEDVERRVAIEPRPTQEPKWGALARVTGADGWELPADVGVHALGTDAVARRIVTDGVLYPCQAIFLTPQAAVVSEGAGETDLRGTNEPFVIVEDVGVVTRDPLNPAASASLSGLAQVARRLPASAPIQYLREDQVRDLLCADVYHYRSMVEDNSGSLLSRGPVTTI
jgi:rhamnose utilization protein RhaD (predicted bifunctional aldolase and dehydrogenase)